MYGLDYLGGAAYQSIVLQNHPSGFAAGIFAREFGDAFPLVQKLSKSGKCPIIRVQLTWAGSSHNYTSSHLQAAIKEAKRYDKIGGTSHIQLSGFCEHTLSSPDVWLDKIAEAAPSCTIINNPENGKGAFSHKYQNEIHTGMPPHFGLYNFSYDGQSACDADIEQDKIEYSEAQIMFLWTWQLNCHFNARDTTRQTTPKPELIKALSLLSRPKGQTDLPKNWLWKSFAEQSDPNGDMRSNKPMCITPLNTSHLDLVKNGKVLASLPRYKDPYVDGRQRYYLSQWSYKVAIEVVELRANGKLIGHVNPNFRDGSFK